MPYLSGTFTIETHEGYNECPCEYDCDWSTSRFSDEPDFTVEKCTLSVVYFGAASLDRKTVASIVGEDEVKRQEAMFADLDLPDRAMGRAA